jgi:hypothetical protein
MKNQFNIGSVENSIVGSEINNSKVIISNTISPDVTNLLREFTTLKEDFSKKLEKTLDSLNIPEKEMKEVKSELKRVFPKMKKLEASSRKFLINGEYLKKKISQIPDGDYSPVVLQYGRAIEQEFNKLGISEMLGNCQKKLIGLLKEYHTRSSANPAILSKVNEIDLSKEIFSESYLGYTLHPSWNGCPDISQTKFYKEITSKRNAAGHSGDDSFFTKEQAEIAINDMSEFLQKWTEITFK